MSRNIILTTLLCAFTLNAAIKKDENYKLPDAPTPKAAEKKALPELLEKLRKRGEQGAEDMKPAELEAMLRELLEAQGVAKEKLKGASLLELLRMMQEKGGFPPGPLDESFGFMDRKTEQKMNEHFRGLLDGHRPGTAKVAAATFILRDAKKPALPIALGTGIHAGGWLLTKASEVKGAAMLQAEVRGAWVAARVERTWDDHDLALLKIEAKDISAVQWSQQPAPGLASFLTAVAPEGKEPVAIGLVSVETRSLTDKGRGFLGVQVEADGKGLKVSRLVADSAALKSGVKMDDLIMELDGKKPDTVFAFIKLISERKAGEKVKLKLLRGEEIVEKEIALGDRASASAGIPRARLDRMNGMGSTISKRRDNFPSVIQTDFPLEANQCGGPVTDLDGNAVGIVIARSGRIETLVLPAATIREVLGDVDFAK